MSVPHGCLISILGSYDYFCFICDVITFGINFVSGINTSLYRYKIPKVLTSASR